MKLFVWGLLDALGVFLYTLLVGYLMINGNQIFGKFPEPSLVGPAVFLCIFVLSALVTGGLMVGGPVYLYFEKKKKAAIKLLAFNGVGLLILILGVMVWMISK